MRSSEHHAAKQKLSCIWQHIILTTCRDAGCKRAHKHVGPVLYIHHGLNFVYSGDNKHLEDRVSRGNGTLWEVVLVKLKPHAQEKWKYYYGKKVRTVLASNVQHLEV